MDEQSEYPDRFAQGEKQSCRSYGLLDFTKRLPIDTMCRDEDIKLKQKNSSSRTCSFS